MKEIKLALLATVLFIQEKAKTKEEVVLLLETILFLIENDKLKLFNKEMSYSKMEELYKEFKNAKNKQDNSNEQQNNKKCN